MKTLTPAMLDAINVLADEIAISTAPAVFNHEVLVALKNSLRHKQELLMKGNRADIALAWASCV